jgi:hypothetical protein
VPIKLQFKVITHTTHHNRSNRVGTVTADSVLVSRNPSSKHGDRAESVGTNVREGWRHVEVHHSECR